MVTSATTAKPNFDPTKILIISTYVGLWVVHYIIVHASGHPRYKDVSKGKLNPAFVILLTEFVKLFVSATILVVQKCRSKEKCSSFVHHARTFEIRPVATLFKQYLPVAFLYAVSNNLMINNLQYFDPTAYVILSSSRLIMTAIVMRIYMGKSLTRMKQISILIITVGLCMKETSSSESTSQDADSDPDPMTNSSHLGLLLLQMLCGVLASVYNETLLKTRKNVMATTKSLEKNETWPKPITNIHAANMCLYAESILLNGFAVMVMPHASMDHSSFKSNLDFVLSSFLRQGIILTLAMVGILSSFIICNIDSLSKSVASASTVLFTTVLGRILFGYEISYRVALSAVFVSVGVHSFTFSNEKRGNDITPTSVALSLSKTLRQLWFMPLFFYLIAMVDLHRLMPLSIPANDDTLYLPTGISVEYLKNEQWLDENLHRLGSNRDLTPDEWQQYVRHHLSTPLVKTLLETKGCRVLDIGCGGGAFSRSLLQLHEGIEIVGVDHSKTMIKTSKTSLQSKFPTYSASVASMEDSASMRKAVVTGGSNGAFHIAMLMDSLCYLPNIEAVQKTIANSLYPLHQGGLLIASMIPQTAYETRQYCETAITREWIKKMSGILGYEILELGSVNENGLYSFILKKTGQKTVDVRATNQRVNSSESSLVLSDWPLPEGLQADEQTIKSYRTAQDIIYYIVSKLEEKNAPVMLKWGTALHEFRSGVENNFVPDFNDKDIDIGVFQRHFGLILDMAQEIVDLSGWRIYVRPRSQKRKPFIAFFGPKSDRRLQIDIYPVECNLIENIAWYSWDTVRMRLNAILPMKGTTWISNRGTWISSHTMYMPSDPACYLENIFGPDFRTPMKTSYHRKNATDGPICKTPAVDATEKLELMRQLMLCGSCELSNMNHNAIANFSSRLPVTSPLCGS
mmetsp:Transcript_126/g.151  ORF Transcript_126/g.151 Transcript_126/m.151 type:complete len:914 (-) Transcript_126:147-2888(-)|eukprot:CAMPEP_0198148294 /NCGR_PEP_ID=MMETSP1443-20131203/40861_1 /TAXON_ID=186043 /ORGANISM="Entomoneis sp., Strain CCMP2396" /LENGTH=913 /DNA_ID=CAMNT_0043812949 /DNA_START=85 /DNA_END=2826 /DNA_ORIENTATION=+